MINIMTSSEEREQANTKEERGNEDTRCERAGRRGRRDDKKRWKWRSAEKGEQGNETRLRSSEEGLRSPVRRRKDVGGLKVRDRN